MRNESKREIAAENGIEGQIESETSNKEVSGTNEAMCSCNRSRGYDELKQRNEQLEQMAKKLYDDVWTLTLLDMRKGDFDTKVKKTEEQLREYREQLVALGVEVDEC